jgi:hypothetical protein
MNETEKKRGSISRLNHGQLDCCGEMHPVFSPLDFRTFRGLYNQDCKMNAKIIVIVVIITFNATAII